MTNIRHCVEEVMFHVTQSVAFLH